MIEQRRLVWGAIGGSLTHYNGAVQVFSEGQNQSRVVWTADFLPNEAADQLTRHDRTGHGGHEENARQMAASPA